MKEIFELLDKKSTRFHLIGWLLLTIGHFSLFVNLYAPLDTFMYTSLNISFVALLFYANVYAVNKWAEKQRPIPYIVFFIVAFGGGSFLRFFSNKYFVAQSAELLPNLQPDVRLILTIIVSTLLVWVVSFIYVTMTNRYRNERQLQSVIHAQNQAQIQFLKAQINPHFLFNTLNNIYSLAVVKSDLAPQMILLLSDLLRYVIYEGKDGKVKLDKEVQHIRKFIALYQMRNEEMQDVQMSIDGKIDRQMLEPMILIPLVENCFKHSDLDTNPDGYIRLILKIEENRLIFTTENTKNEANRQKDKTGGVGLSNIQRRLAVLYGASAKLEIENQAHLFIIHLTLPYEI